MDVFDALLHRRSVSPRVVGDPGPDDAQLDLMFRAGARAADHGSLRPWRFIVVRGDARAALGEVFAKARAARDPSAKEADLARERAKPLRTPVMIALGVHLRKDKAAIRPLDQILATAAAGQNILLAAFALGFGAMWLTGSNCYDALVKQALGLQESDAIAGFLYIGSLTQPMPEPIEEELGETRVIWTP
jgi:nitroreductase